MAWEFSLIVIPAFRLNIFLQKMIFTTNEICLTPV